MFNFIKLALYNAIDYIYRSRGDDEMSKKKTAPKPVKKGKTVDPKKTNKTDKPSYDDDVGLPTSPKTPPKTSPTPTTEPGEQEDDSADDDDAPSTKADGAPPTPEEKMTLAHAALDECVQDFILLNSEYDNDDVSNARFGMSVQAYQISTLGQVAAVTHTPFVRESLTQLRSYLKEWQGDPVFRLWHLFAVDQLERAIPASQPQADLTEKSFNIQ